MDLDEVLPETDHVTRQSPLDQRVAGRRLGRAARGDGSAGCR